MAWTTPRTWVTAELVTSTMMNEQVRDNSNSMQPVGSYMLRAANYQTVETAVESRWLQCNGVAVSRTTYAALFNHLNGLTPALAFGTGDGSTTFTLPDLRGRGAYAEGEHADVDAMGDSDGDAIANRTPKRKTYTSHDPTGSGGGTQLVKTDLDIDPGYLVAGSWFIKYVA